jgi:hypothetical protein
MQGTTVAHTTDTTSESDVTTTTENAAALGLPAPNSFPTRTLHIQHTKRQLYRLDNSKLVSTAASCAHLAAALNPTEIMNTHPFTVMLLNKEEEKKV